MITHINEEDFIDEVLKSRDLVIVDFSANWCGPCKMLSPVLEKVSNENKNIRILKMDIDESPRIVRRYGIRSIPMLIFFKNGRVVDEIVGFTPKERINEAIIDNL